ncbi:MAG: hypothetical protein Q9227_008631 [Pyrenula ochraceoflavens]
MLGLRSKPLGFPKAAPINEKMDTPHTPKTNGHDHRLPSNGTMMSSPGGASFSQLRSGSSSVIYSSEQSSIQMTIVRARKRMTTELVNVDEFFINEMSIETFVDFLNKERLTSMPHRGSKWDRALRSAEYFALQLSSYAEVLEEFTPAIHDGVNVALASCCLLLQLGREQARGLEASFAVLYRIGLSLRFLIKNSSFAVDFSIQRELQQAFCTLLGLVSEMAVTIRAKLSATSRRRATFDFFSVFGKTIDSFHRQKETIADAMWTFALQQERIEPSMNISAIRQWLEPGDEVLKLLASDTYAAKTNRAEFTCEWFQSHLLDFVRSSSQTFAITGPTGSGKTVLAGWIEERLQRLLARKPFETIEYRFESDLPTESSTLACVKSLLLQLLQQNVGNAKLFSKLLATHRAYISSGNATELETSLWDALELGLEAYNNGPTHLIVIIDGLEKICGGDAKAREFAKRVHSLAKEHICVRALILSRSKYTNNLDHVKEMQLTSTQTHDDIRRMVDEILQKNDHFKHGLSREEQMKVREQIVDGANGSFLWAELVTRSVILEDSSKSFSKSVDEAPKELQELFDRLMTKVHLKQPEVKRLLGWLLVARRPLTTSELSDLLRVDIQHNVVSDKKTDIHNFLRKSFGLLLVTQSHSMVRFRHSALRQYLSLLIKRGLLPPFQDSQNDLLLRMLLYSKQSFQDAAPSFELLPRKDSEDIYRRHCLLEYSLTYWVTHLRETSMWQEGTFELTAEFKAVFPSSVQMILCEWSRWNASLTSRGSLELHDLCLRLRKDVFGEKHVAVLQTLVVLGSIHHECHHFDKANGFIFHASQLAIETRFQSFALKCSTTFLTFTELTADVTRTEIIVHRERLLKFVITEYRQQEECELVIRYSKLLIQLYVQIKEEKSAEHVHTELREFVIKFYGHHSEELAEIEHLTITFGKGKEPKEVTPWEGGSIFVTYDEYLEEVDITQIEIIIRKAESHESRGEIFLAEEVFVSLWRRMVELCHTETSIEYHAAKFDCAIAYVRFLRRIHRHEEATAILICLWAEYESTSLSSEILVLRLKKVAELMRSFGLSYVAVSVFQKVWGWFKQTGKTHHEEAQSTTIQISETVEEVTTRETTEEIRSETTTTSKSSTTVTEESKTMIQEIFKSQISSYKSTKETRSIVKSCSALVAVYFKEERWQEAISTVTATLEIVWAVVLSGVGMIALPEICVHEAIDIAIRLAQCYVEEHRFEEAERIYIRIYQACIFSLHIEDEQVTRAFNCLITFYEQHHRHEKTIEIYSDIILCYKRQLGVGHARTIRMLYAFGGLLRRYGYIRCYECYSEIVSVLNKGSRVCHSDAFEAAVILMQYYSSEKRWAETRDICETLWAAFVHHHHERKFELEIVKSIYATYSTVLEVHLRADFMLQRKIALEYRETSSKYFGVSSTIAIEASLAYASVCERHEKYEYEAISVYEEVMKKTLTLTSTASTTISTSTSTSILQRVETKLTKLYVKTISSSQTTTSTTTVERAISLSVERYTETRKSLGCWHETTISQLHAVLVLYRKLNTKEAHTSIVSMLRELVVEIVAVEKSSWRLYSAAVAIANIFLELEMSADGFDLLQDLHGQIVANEKASTEKFKVRLSHHHDKITYIFLVALELKLRKAVKISYSEIMVTLITEKMLFESFKRVTESKTEITVVLVHGARLRQFLHSHQRQHQCQIVEKQIFDVFMHSYGASIKTFKHQVSFFFVMTVLDELIRVKKDIDITHTACVSGVNKVTLLLDRGEYREASDLANCLYHFTSSRNAFRDLQNVGWGLKLCQYLAGSIVSRVQDEKLRHQMTELSKTILQHILKACSDSGLQLVRLPVEDLEKLVTLLGRQHNYGNLEVSQSVISRRVDAQLKHGQVLLQQLWTSREAQKLWSQDLILGTGRSLVNVKFAHGHKDAAIELCEDICYNLRRARGSTDPSTLVFYQLLAELQTSTDRLEDALLVHKDVLKLIVDGEDHDDYDVDDAASDAAMLPVVDRHVQRLRNTCLRLGGLGDHQEQQEIKSLVAKVLARFPTIKVERPEKWDVSKKKGALSQEEESMGTWKEPATWSMKMDVQGSNRRHQTKRVFSNHGMNGAYGLHQRDVDVSA